MSLKQLVDDHQIAIPCPQCAQETKGKLGRFRTQRHFRCAGCGADVEVDTKQLDKEVGALERQLKGLGFR